MESIPRQPHWDDDATPSAPGDLDLVRAFLSVHDHVYGTRRSLAPSADTIAWWLGKRGLIDPEAETDPDDLRLAVDVLEALRSLVRENEGAARDPDAIRVLDDAARDTGMSIRFGSEAVEPTGSGVRAAIGRILATAFLAQVDGRWGRFKECSSTDCRSVFWDRSKNRSGRWCSMKDCGNRAKVRAYRARERAGA
jgi:CGNR zinc finger/Putative stress-induced transcription regulator